MSIWNGIKTPLIKLANASRGKSVDSSITFIVGNSYNDDAVPTKDDYYNFATQGFGRNSLIYACINQIVSSASEAPLVARKYIPNKKQYEIDDKGKLAKLIKMPCPTLSGYEWLEVINLYLEVTGNVYLFKLRDSTGQVIEIHPLRSDRIKIWVKDGEILGYLYTVDGERYFIKEEDIAHIKLPDPADDWYGLSPIHVIYREANLDTAMTTFINTFFTNAGVPFGFLKVKRRIANSTEADKIRERWSNQFSGVTGWHRLGILDEDAEYKELAAKPDQMAMPDIRNLTESRICSIFGVPASIVGVTLGMQSSSYANRLSDRQLFWEGTLMPHYARIVSTLNRVLLPEFPQEAARGIELGFDFSRVSALQEDVTKKTKRVTDLWQKGVITRNEARSDLGYDTVGEEGDIYHSTLNEVYIDKENKLIQLAGDNETALPGGPGRGNEESTNPNLLPGQENPDTEEEDAEIRDELPV